MEKWLRHIVGLLLMIAIVAVIGISAFARLKGNFYGTEYQSQSFFVGLGLIVQIATAYLLFSPAAIKATGTTRSAIVAFGFVFLFILLYRYMQEWMIVVELFLLFFRWRNEDNHKFPVNTRVLTAMVAGMTVILPLGSVLVYRSALDVFWAAAAGAALLQLGLHDIIFWHLPKDDEQGGNNGGSDQNPQQPAAPPAAPRRPQRAAPPPASDDDPWGVIDV